MGVLNITPDSFSDGGQFTDLAAALAHARQMVADGAHWIDVGGESTRPGATPVALVEEQRRVLPVVEALAAEGIAVSIDTRHASVARAAVAAGATMINDVGASLGPVAAEHGVAWVAVHSQGEPASMQIAPRYRDVVAEVLDYLVGRAEAALDAGVVDVWIDPGVGFGKTTAHNLTLLAHLDRFVATGHPVLVGTSRKGFLGGLLGISDGSDVAAPVADRLEGSLATATWAMANGVAMVRVHDVRPTTEAALVIAGQIITTDAAA
ncbi:MAG: dihydropteroate synthase [Acidimicrobiia bacterium]|nr:dihydropteroate synthase [Acidimicrobiia bacterium]